MNFALDMPLNTFIENFAKSSNCENENFTQDINNLMLSHLESVKNMVYSNKNILSKNKNFEIIKNLILLDCLNPRSQRKFHHH